MLDRDRLNLSLLAHGFIRIDQRPLAGRLVTGYGDQIGSSWPRPTPKEQAAGESSYRGRSRSVAGRERSFVAVVGDSIRVRRCAWDSGG
jgi:hypothetical protein